MIIDFLLWCLLCALKVINPFIDNSFTCSALSFLHILMFLQPDADIEEVPDTGMPLNQNGGGVLKK